MTAIACGLWIRRHDAVRAPRPAVPGSPEAIAYAAVYLASEEAAFVHGIVRTSTRLEARTPAVAEECS
jgi:uncharacterized protein (DUF849 family)